MKRIAIINHTTDTLFVEDINEEILEGQYNNDIEMYVHDNYYPSDDLSWGYISDAQYIPEFEKDPIEIDFEENTPKEILEWDEENKKINLEF
jgi:hypothetical protein